MNLSGISNFLSRINLKENGKFWFSPNISLLSKELVEALTAKTRSDRGNKIGLCYTLKTFSCLKKIKDNINHCLELAPSFLKMYNINLFPFKIAKKTILHTAKNKAFFNVMLFHFKFLKFGKKI